MAQADWLKQAKAAQPRTPTKSAAQLQAEAAARQQAQQYSQQAQQRGPAPDMSYLQNKPGAIQQNAPNWARAAYNYFFRPSGTSLSKPGPTPVERQQRANSAWAQRYQAQVDRRNGLNGPNWTRSDWVPPADYRQKYADIMMTPQEAALRSRNAAVMTKSYQDYLKQAAATPNVSHDINSQWAQDNPAPAGMRQLQQEWVLRNNVAPPGYMYTGFGSSYAKLPTVPSLPAEQPASSSYYGGGGYGWNDWGGGGGGGGWSNWDSAPNIGSWYNQMTQWNINQVKPG